MVGPGWRYPSSYRTPTGGVHASPLFMAPATDVRFTSHKCETARIVTIALTADAQDSDHSITSSATSSARPSSDGGIVRPSSLAVLRLMISSNLVGCGDGTWRGAPGRTACDQGACLFALARRVGVAVLNRFRFGDRLTGSQKLTLLGPGVYDRNATEPCPHSMHRSPRLATQASRS
jgi:hypothetical protein